MTEQNSEVIPVLGIFITPVTVALIAVLVELARRRRARRAQGMIHHLAWAAWAHHLVLFTLGLTMGFVAILPDRAFAAPDEHRIGDRSALLLSGTIVFYLVTILTVAQALAVTYQNRSIWDTAFCSSMIWAATLLLLGAHANGWVNTLVSR